MYNLQKQKPLSDIDGCVENWQRLQILGSGTFATITLWVNKETDEHIALKQNHYNIDGYDRKQIENYLKRWQQEIAYMRELNCENVVKALDLPNEFSKLALGMPILAMEYCSGGDLRKVLNEPKNCCGLSEKEIRQILRQISSAIICLHSKNIIHRDLKPENIVLKPLSNNRIIYKLTDLGYAKQLNDTTLANSFVGTVEYLAPELFMNEPHRSSIDNWSFGVIAFEIVTGRRPFLPNYPVTQVIDAITKKKDYICTEFDEKGNFYYSSEIPQINHINSDLKSDLEKWLKTVLQFNPQKRGGDKSFEEIIKITNKYHVQIFSFCSYEIFSFSIDYGTTLNQLKNKIYESTKILPKNQYLFFQNGDLVDEYDNEVIGRKIITTWYQPESWSHEYNPIIINVFDYSNEIIYDPFYRYLYLPNRIQMILMNVNGTDTNIDDPNKCDKKINFDEIKLTWRLSIFIIRQIITKYQSMHETLKSFLLNIIIMFNRLKNQQLKLYFKSNELFSMMSVMEKFIENIHHQQHNYDNDNVNIDGHNNCLESIIKKFEIITTYQHKLFKYFNDNDDFMPKIDKNTFLFKEFFQSFDNENLDQQLLYQKYDTIQKNYDIICKLKYQSCKTSNNDIDMKNYATNHLIVKLLCDLFKLIEKLFENLFKIFSKLSEYLLKIMKQNSNCKKFEQKLIDLQSNDFNQSKQQQLITIIAKYQITHQNMNSQQRKSTSSTESSSSDFIFLPNGHYTTSIDNLNEILKKFRHEQSKWQSKKFDFKTLEFKDFLF